MPEYIGEIRTTVVAANNGSYGAASTNSTVNKPLMLSVALPRLLTPGDITDIPVTVFAMRENIGKVKVKMTTDDKITLISESTQTVQFDTKGEQLVWFKARINQTTGTSTLRTEASGGAEKATVTEDITVRIPNPRITKIEAKEVKSRRNHFFRYSYYWFGTFIRTGNFFYPPSQSGTTADLPDRLSAWLCRTNHFAGISSIIFTCVTIPDAGTIHDNRK